jgi:competence protein ComEC
VTDRGAPYRLDLRLPALGGAAWAAALAARVLPGALLGPVGLIAGLALTVAAARRRSPTLLGWLLVGGAVVLGIGLRSAAVHASPVAALAADRATVSVSLVVTSDPRVVAGRFGDRVVLRGSVRAVTGRGVHHDVRAPVLVFAPTGGADGWEDVRYGATLHADGRLAPSDDPDLAGLLSARGPPHPVDGPSVVERVVARVRAGIVHAVGDRSTPDRALVPALVDGDDTAIPADLRDDFRATGLTHLLAVSGTNLTLVVGAVLLVARGVGVRARGLVAVGCVGVVGFVLLARAEPSVLRAAVMGAVGLLGMAHRGRERGARALGACVVALMLADPALATSPGFALSAVATAGILFLAPPWRDSLGRWLPRWAAEAVAVPTAAQVACTPLVAALSGQVSLVAVGANLAAAPAVAPATVLGLAGGLLDLVWHPLGRLAGAPAAWSAGWIAVVARQGADVPVAAARVSTGPFGLAGLTLGCLMVTLALGGVFARRGLTLGACALLVVVVLVPLPSFGWPPRGWVLVMCDVGQGDGLALNSGNGTALVVDTGPDPTPMDRCLRSLGVRRVPLVVLTHFHADHVGGLAGVLHGRAVGGIEVSPYDDPVRGADRVRALARQAGVPVATATYGETRRLGELRWQVLAPSAPPPADSASPPNDESIVLVVETRGVRLLLMGDEETGSQQRLHALFPDLHADVLKVAHHGSAKQDPDLVRGLGARIALVSVGRDNDYGHPAPSTLRLLAAAHLRTWRTDRQGSVAVVATSAGLVVVTRRGA